MSNTTIVSSTNFSPEQKEVLDSFQNHIEALIKKDKAAIEDYLDHKALSWFIKMENLKKEKDLLMMSLLDN